MYLKTQVQHTIETAKNWRLGDNGVALLGIAPGSACLESATIFSKSVRRRHPGFYGFLFWVFIFYTVSRLYHMIVFDIGVTGRMGISSMGKKVVLFAEAFIA